MKVLDPKVGGKIRAIITVIAAVASWVLAATNALSGIDWQGSTLVTVLAVVQALAHFSPVGNTTTE